MQNLLRILLSAILITTVTTASAGTTVIGTQGDGQYYVNLSSEDGVEGKAALDMEIVQITVKIMDDRLEKGKFLGALLSGAAINNSVDVVGRNSIQFSNIKKRTPDHFQKGDAFQIERFYGGTRITLNGALLVETESDELFNLFSKIWLGGVPASYDGRAILLGLEETKKAIKKAFSALRFTEDRASAVYEISQVDNKARLEKQRQEQEAARAAELAVAAAKEEAELEAKIAAQAKRQQAQKVKEAERKKLLAAREEAKKKAYQMRLAQIEAEKKLDKQLKKEQAEQAAERARAEVVRLEAEHYQDVYSMVSQAVVYPQAAAKRGVEGEISLVINFKKNGEREIKVTNGESVHRTLQRGVVKQVSKLPLNNAPEKVFADKEVVSVLIPFSFIMH